MIYCLSKENLALAVAEVLALAQPKTYQLYENLLVCDGTVEYSRLAYTRMVLEEIFIDTTIPDVDWQAWYNKDFCVRSNITSKEKEVAAIIWHGVQDPKVRLKGATSEFFVFFIGKKIVCGKKVYTQKESFKERRPDRRPGFFPISLKPKLARAIVNLSGVKKGTIWDPFCGTGGILLEASLIGLDVVGSDVDPAMIRATKVNFEAYHCRGSFFIGDARTAKVDCTAVVTDPPYGRRASTKKVDKEQLYNDFLVHVYPFIQTVVLMAPQDLRIVSPYTTKSCVLDYVHNTLTRKIMILTKDGNEKREQT